MVDINSVYDNNLDLDDESVVSELREQAYNELSTYLSIRSKMIYEYIMEHYDTDEYIEFLTERKISMYNEKTIKKASSNAAIDRKNMYYPLETIANLCSSYFSTEVSDKLIMVYAEHYLKSRYRKRINYLVKVIEFLLTKNLIDKELIKHKNHKNLIIDDFSLYEKKFEEIKETINKTMVTFNEG